MRIDNYSLFPDRPPTPREKEFWEKLTAIMVKEPDMEYVDIVRTYRQLEEEFINRAGYNEWEVLETKRHIAESIFSAGSRAEQPFDVCRDNWNALVELGFSSIERYCTMSWFYVDSCVFNAQYDAGLEMVDMVTTEIHRRLEEPGLTRHAKKYYDHELTHLGTLRERLTAYKSSETEGNAWDERRQAEIDSNQPPHEEQAWHLRGDLIRAMKPIADKSPELSFEELVREYRQVETDFLAGLETEDEFFVPELKQRITWAIFKSAHAHRQPFEVCRDLWNDLAPWDFGHLEHQCDMIKRYAECCLFNGQAEAGLAVVEPLRAELQRQVDTDTGEELSPKRYLEEIARLEQLRDELEALPR